MVKTIEFLDNIERLEAFEEQFGIRLEGLSVSLAPIGTKYSNASYIDVNGDIFAINGTTIDQDIELVISCHDFADRVLVSKKHPIKARSFLGLDTFLVEISYELLPFVTVEKVRIYPKLAT
jgi:hypothetical protein